MPVMHVLAVAQVIVKEHVNLVAQVVVVGVKEPVVHLLGVDTNGFY